MIINVRCKNCGWENAATNAKCDKCSASFTDQMAEVGHYLPQENVFSGIPEPKKTVEGCPECGYPLRKKEHDCPQCGHQLCDVKQVLPVDKEPVPVKEPPAPPTQIPDIHEPVCRNCTFCNTEVVETAHFCPNCGVSLSNEYKTMSPWLVAEAIRAPECLLSFIPREGEPEKIPQLRFSGNLIQLNRGNTEPANQTITSTIQAELTFENDQWYLQDKSVLKTTYIYAGEKTALKPGDIIVLGNRSFQFNCISKNPSE